MVWSVQPPHVTPGLGGEGFDTEACQWVLVLQFWKCRLGEQPTVGCRLWVGAHLTNQLQGLVAGGWQAVACSVWQLHGRSHAEMDSGMPVCGWVYVAGACHVRVSMCVLLSPS